MSNHSRRSPLCSSLIAFLAILCLATVSTFAAPADEITRAVRAGGAASVEAATPAQFSRALSSVLTRVKENRFPSYTTAAIGLRPDLAPQITAAVLRAHRPDGRVDDSCQWVDGIIRAALAAAPSAKDAIVRAALEAEPSARECILTAAGVSGGTQPASFRPPGIDAGNINSTSLGTINPGNLGAQGNIQSPGQERFTICHNGNTLTLPRPAAEAHLRNHPTDTLGPCP